MDEIIIVVINVILIVWPCNGKFSLLWKYRSIMLTFLYDD